MSTPFSTYGQQGIKKVITGSILIPVNSGTRFILNPCFSSGKWGTDFQNELTNKWKKVKSEYLNWKQTSVPHFGNGRAEYVTINADTWVINMTCLNDDGTFNKTWTDNALKEVINMAKNDNGTIHMNEAMTKYFKSNEDALNYFSSKGFHSYIYQAE